MSDDVWKNRCKDGTPIFFERPSTHSPSVMPMLSTAAEGLLLEFPIGSDVAVTGYDAKKQATVVTVIEPWKRG